MKELIDRSYQAIVDRGLITPTTTQKEFIHKIIEEYNEAICEYYDENEEQYIEELTDLATVCIMQIQHLGYGFIKEFENGVLKNEKRANHVTKHI